MLEIGAFPFLVKKGKIYIMLITNSSGKLWILPKGQPEKNLNQAQVAELESYEEAGVKGKVINSRLHKEFKRDNSNTLEIYPLLIKKTLTEWPEDSYRKRRLVSIKEALLLVTRKEHVNAIKHFSKPENSKILLKYI
ncbi:MAG: NUDIX hydrolase [Gammaproteobacteria bacterium]|nr:NUDIX hydrolase [Gammaproteobacteria bacterium]